MKLFTIYVGIGKDKLGNEIGSDERALSLEAAKRMLTNEFGGYSIEDVRGGYKHRDGRTVEEDSVRLELVVPDELATQVRIAAGKMRDMFRQESVLVAAQPVESEFI